ncbi:hypothetical protein AK812_SmicGene45995, partial [Symbiodinium microadriaticum]
ASQPPPPRLEEAVGIAGAVSLEEMGPIRGDQIAAWPPALRLSADLPTVLYSAGINDRVLPAEQKGLQKTAVCG